MQLQDQVVVITGASRGVGAACARACAAQGARVVLASKTTQPHPKLPGTLGEVAKEVEELGSEALVVPTDVRFEEQVDHLIDTTVAHFGRLDAVVNNAGAIFWAPVADWTSKKYDLVMGVNVRAAFLLSRAAMPHLRKRGGHIIMMSPPLVTDAAAGKAPYLLSKLGMTLLAQGIDAEEERVHACALWPVTGIRTAATQNLGMGNENEWRTPAILADSTVALLSGDPLTSVYRAWLDEQVLAAHGVDDLKKYRCHPDHEPTPMSIQLIDPGWTRT